MASDGRKQPAASVVSAKDITVAEFRDALARYPSVVGAISEAKGARKGQQSLLELDNYRYGQALEEYGLGRAGSREMDLDAVTKLVSWKLRHGTFRPALMKNVTSNDAAFVKKTIADAMAIYKGSSDVSKTIDTLTKLKGIGPATASLLLAVHDPDNVIFFADEAFYWLCGDGKIVPIKYNPKEYKQLYSEAKKLASRLNVAAVEVEKVAFVLMRYKGEDGKDMDKDSSSSSSSSKASGGVPTASSKRQEGTAPKATLSGGTAAAAAAAPKAAAAVSVPKRVEKRKEPVGGGDGGGGGHKDARRQDDDGWNQAVRRSKRVR